MPSADVDYCVGKDDVKNNIAELLRDTHKG